MTATSIFVHNPASPFVGLWVMIPAVYDTFQKRLRFACDRVGGQSEMARRATAVLKSDDENAQPISTQAVQYLCRETVEATDDKPGHKAAQGSALTSLFAHVAGVEALWLATGIGRIEAPSAPAKDAAEFVDTFPPDQRSRLVLGFKLTANRTYIIDGDVPAAWNAAAKQAARPRLQSKQAPPLPLIPDEGRQEDD